MVLHGANFSDVRYLHKQRMTRLFWCVYLNGKKTLILPLNKMAEGADLCLENALQFCSDARVLIERTSYAHALGFCIFAVEELGKAILLKTKATYAQKESKADVILNKEKPESLFHMTTEDLKAKGFKCTKEKEREVSQGVYPFYDHLSKLLIASNMMYLATRTNVMKSLAGKRFQRMDEINKAIENFWKEAYEINVYHTDLRELALYVDYDQKHGVWKKGRLELNQEKLRQLVVNIETAIELNRQWKLYPNQKP